jgi:hypothetical protein
MIANKGFKSKNIELKNFIQEELEFPLSAAIAYQKNLLCSTLRKKKKGYFSPFLSRHGFWEIAVATIEDLAIAVRSSREPDEVGR